MIGNRPQLQIDLVADANKAAKEVEKLRKDFNTSFTNIAAATELATKAYQAFTQVLSVAVDFAKESISLANEQVRVETRISAALKRKGDVTGETFRQLQAFNSAVQQSLGFGDEQLLQLQGSLSLMGVRNDQLIEATKYTIGLANATGQDLNSASRVIARAIQGETSALTRYGITVSDVTEAQRELQSLFEASEAQAGTFATGISVLQANYGDLQEQIGFAFTESDALRGVMEEINNVLLETIEVLQSPAWREHFEVVLREAIASVKQLWEYTKAFGEVYSQVASVVSKVHPIQIATRAWEAWASVIDRVKGALGVVSVEALEVLPEHQGGKQLPFGPDLPPGFSTGAGAGTVAPPSGRRGGKAGGKAGGEGGKSDWYYTYEAEVNEVMNLAYAKQQELEGRTKKLQDKLIQNTFEFTQKQTEAQIKASTQAQTNSIQLVSQITAGAFTGMVQSIASGAQSVGQAMAQFVGTVITQLGTFLIQLGIAGQAAAALSWLFPPAAGGLVAGTAAVIAGTAMVALGSGISAAAGGGGVSAPSGRSNPTQLNQGTFVNPTVVRQELQPSPGSVGNSGTTVNINFNGVVTNPRRTAREISDVLQYAT